MFSLIRKIFAPSETPIEERLPSPEEYGRFDFRTQCRIGTLKDAIASARPNDSRLPEWRQELEALVTEGFYLPPGISIIINAESAKLGSG
jgi:hypothetical protein